MLEARVIVFKTIMIFVVTVLAAVRGMPAMVVRVAEVTLVASIITDVMMAGT